MPDRPDVSQPATNAPAGLASGRVTGQVRRPAQLDLLNVFIGRWVTEGETVGDGGATGEPIVASDVYQWAPGGHFVVHPAYGRIGSIGVGGIEVIGYDESTGQFQTHFFDSAGNTTTETLSYREGIWTWQATHARCTGVFSDSGRTLTASHERSDDGLHWTPSMRVTLRKIE